MSSELDPSSTPTAPPDPAWVPQPAVGDAVIKTTEEPLVVAERERHRAVGLLAAGAVLLVAIAGFWVIGKAKTHRVPRPVSRAAAPVPAVAKRVNLRSARAVSTDGHAEPLVAADTRVVVVVSTSCTHCHAFLSALAAAVSGDSLPRLTVLTVEGPKLGAKLMTASHLRARSVGPSVTTVPELVKRTGLVGTPTLYHLDDDGNILETSMGEQSPDEVARWVAWMRGRSAENP